MGVRAYRLGLLLLSLLSPRKAGAARTVTIQTDAARRDVDGKLYTLAEFRSFYAQFPQVDGSSSDVDGVAYQYWSAAKHWVHRMTKEIKAKIKSGAELDEDEEAFAEAHELWK